MSGLLAALVGLTSSIVARVLMSLGMSVVTVGGVSVVMTELKSLILTNFGGAPLAVVQLAGLAGVWKSLGLLFGAITFSLSYWALTQSVQILGKK